MQNNSCYVSVVVPLHNDASILNQVVQEIFDVLHQRYVFYEVILVDDGSTDNTRACVTEILRQFHNLRYVRLSRRFGEENAIAAGLDGVIGDYVVVMRPDQDPPSCIPAIVEECERGAQIVIGVRRHRQEESWIMRWSAELFYWYCHHVLKVMIPKNSTEFCGLSRQAGNSIFKIKDQYRSLRLFSTMVGFSQKNFHYDPISRYGKPRRTFRESVRKSLAIITTNSIHPLRFLSGIGLVLSMLNLLYTFYVVGVFLLKKNVISGWTTLSLQNSLMFAFLFFILTVMCEYLGHVLRETKDRPLYFIAEEQNSAVLVSEKTVSNVVGESEKIPA